MKVIMIFSLFISQLAWADWTHPPDAEVISDSQESYTTNYLCLPKMATGFASSSGEWKIVEFSVQDQKFLLKQRKGKWYWTEFGRNTLDKGNQCGQFNKEGFLDCKYFGELISFNKKTLRFQMIHPYGYVISDLEAEKELPLLPVIVARMK